MKLFEVTTEPTSAEAAIDTRRIIELLRLRHAPPEWASFVELRGGTGFVEERRLDFFAMHTWPSKGYTSVVYEIKVSRSDFARELQNPKKRALAESVAAEGYFAVPLGLVQPDEVPDGWGLLVADKSGLRRLKMATQRRVEAWPMSFVASIARVVAEGPSPLPKAAWKVAGREVGETELVAMVEEKYGQTLESTRNEAERKAAYKLRESAEYQELAALKAAVVSVAGWGNATAERFKAWVAQTRERPTLSEHDQRKLREACEAIGKLLQEEKP